MEITEEVPKHMTKSCYASPSRLGLSHASIGKISHDNYLFDAVPIHALLPDTCLTDDERANEATMRLHLASGKSAEGRAVN